jgi:hypothetical protein
MLRKAGIHHAASLRTIAALAATIANNQAKAVEGSVVMAKPWDTNKSIVRVDSQAQSANWGEYHVRTARYKTTSIAFDRKAAKKRTPNAVSPNNHVPA